MKKSLIYSIVAASLIGVGCSEDFLDPIRSSNVLTHVDFEENVELNPALIEGTVEGIASYLIAPRGTLGASANRHYDMGQKGVDIWLDLTSGDMALSANSYGWYQSSANLVTQIDYTREENRIIWQFYYKVINTSNEVIISLGGNDAEPEDATVRRMLGQAKTYRAYAYFYLAQIFQRGYDPNQEILPYIDGDEAIAAKVPASKIYDLILSDLNHSIDLLDGYTRNGKHQINKTVAQGILAYVYAAMGDYTQAKTYADEVIASGAPLTTTAQLAFPGAGSGFNDVNNPSWIWGYDLTEDMGHQLIDWWGQIDYFTYSYAAAGDYKSIDNGLYDLIPANDIRKTQFPTTTLGTNHRMPLNKFFDPNRVPQGQQVITTDLLFMRVDEFYLLSAEAEAKRPGGSEAVAKARLIELLSSRLGGQTEAETYVNSLSGQALIDAIYLQTRIELWGEGKSYLAMKRNQATVTRASNHLFRAGESFNYNVDELSFEIPRIEMDNNPAITGQN
ncbi:MAG TPA: RagB/SusD family nutrient uptake outer membrane protein [Chitinophagaceae bacterium]|nr:RagB/SusD family nutrient uptake outer membrane protein [Chitinophagaceae bacterium]